MDKYAKYFLSSAMWLDDGFCEYYVQSKHCNMGDILDVAVCEFQDEQQVVNWLNDCIDNQGY